MDMRRALLGSVLLSAMGMSSVQAQEAPPDLVVIDVAGDVTADTVRITHEFGNAGEGPSFESSLMVVLADGEPVAEDVVGPLDNGQFDGREWLLPVRDEWRGRLVEFGVVIDADGVVEESDEGNNGGGVRLQIPGDPVDPGDPGDPADPGDDGFPWQWPIIGIVVVLGAVEVRQQLKRRRRRRREADSHDADPPADCNPGQVYTTRKCKVRPARRRFTAVVLRPVGAGPAPEPWRAGGEVVKLLNAALRAQRRGSGDKLAVHLDAAALTVVQGLRSLLAAAGGPLDVEVIGLVVGGRVECTFTHSICLGAGWEVESLWTAKIKDHAEQSGGLLRSAALPPADEIERDVGALLRALVERAPLVPPRAPTR